jgi:hypothetical protein
MDVEVSIIIKIKSVDHLLIIFDKNRKKYFKSLSSVCHCFLDKIFNYRVSWIDIAIPIKERI